MTPLTDWQIRELSSSAGLVVPLLPATRTIDGAPIISYGVTSYGYDARLADEFKLPKGPLLDPHAPCEWAVEYADLFGLYVLPPHGFVLARTEEVFSIPRNVSGVVMAKARMPGAG